MPLSIVILAAGQGKRMNSELPKVLQPLAGRPLLKHVIRTAQALAPDDVYVVYGHGGAQVQAALEHEPVHWVLQANQLGTGHAVMQAMGLIPDEHTVLVLYGDVPLIRTPSLKKLVSVADDGTLAVLSVTLSDAAGYGRIVRDADGHVAAIIEHRDANAEQLRIRELNSGLMAAPAGRLREWLLMLGSNNSSREYYLTDVVASAVNTGAGVEAIPVAHPSQVIGVNDRSQLAQAEGFYRKERAEELMAAGASLADPNRIDIRGDISVGRDVFIDVNAVLSGTVKLAAGVHIGPNCVISDSTIGAHTMVHANCVIDGAVVGGNCKIGPFARVRPQTTLHDHVHVGNFVEVKASEIAAGSKANHLSYIGDTRVGANVNVGAGTITCNYDGANKWPTIIEDDAFIGSGSMLVAPVRIGAGATIAAGSTITHNVADGELTVARARQSTIEGWRRAEKLTDSEKNATADAALKSPPQRK